MDKMNEEKLTIENLKGGIVAAQINNALQQVIKNIGDPNTSDATRNITIKLGVAPRTDDRSLIGVSSKVTIGLAGPPEIQALADFKVDDKGQCYAVERRKQRPLFDVAPPEKVEGVLGDK